MQGNCFLCDDDEAERVEAEEHEVVDEQESDGVASHVYLSDALSKQFKEHFQYLKSDRQRLKRSLTVNTVVGPSAEAVAADAALERSSAQGGKVELGVSLDSDRYEGDCVLRTLQALLSTVDDRGYQRSPQQVRFHDAFIRATSRVIYKKDWGRDRPKIMEMNTWAACPSEILISTPRRFGKTFSCVHLITRVCRSIDACACRCRIAIFVAALALSTGLEVVVFSPARRASRKLLERIVEFVRLLDCGDRIEEYNQEQCRLTSFRGTKSLIRSFPSKVRSQRFHLTATNVHTASPRGRRFR